MKVKIGMQKVENYMKLVVGMNNEDISKVVTLKEDEIAKI